MTSEVKVKVIQKETIRPSSPTPQHLRNCSLSFLDQLSPEGEFQFNDSICCKDHGAAFVEARVNCPLSIVCDKPELHLEIIKQLIPADVFSTQAVTGHLLLVQANFFECGGLAIGVSGLHKAADAYTLSKFLNSWAAISLGSDHVVFPAEFGAASSRFPPLDFLNSPQFPVDFTFEKCTRRRFVFDASKIGALKSKAASATVPNPTRVEVVSALIWKCLMEASRSKLGFTKPSVYCQMVNIRKVLSPPLAENLLGSLLGLFITTTEEESEVDCGVQSLVAKFRKGLEKYRIKCRNGVSGEDTSELFQEYLSFLVRGDLETYHCSSWCRFPFYGANFGWGKPSWVTHGADFKNMVLLMDARDGDGIEVYLSLKEDDMVSFESNRELLEYACVSQ